MADPQIIGGIRALVVLQGVTLLPEDQYVNTWAFDCNDGLAPDGADYDDVEDALSEFYNINTTLTNSAIATRLSKSISRTECELRMYHMGQAPPREPEVRPFALAAAVDTDPLPSEVAIASSFYSGRNLPRQRGRVYLGPWQRTVVVTNQTIARPTTEILQTIESASERLAARAGLTTWCVLSSSVAPGGALLPIDNGWVDDAFDTQRRRGEAPTSRRAWSVAE
jgi:hypothetical protein